MKLYRSYDFEMGAQEDFEYSGPLNLAFGGKKKKTTTNEIKSQTNAPLPSIAPAIDLGSDLAQQGIQDISRTPFPGPFTAPVNTTQTQANDALRNLGIQGLESSGQATRDLIPQISGAVGKGLNFDIPQANAQSGFGLQEAIRAGASPILRQVMEQLIPQLKSASIDQGAFSNNRATTILPGQIARDTTEAITDSAGRLIVDDLTSQRQTQGELTDAASRLAGLIPTIEKESFGLSTLPIAALEGAGATEQGFAQQGINEDLAAFQEGNAAPLRGLQDFSNIIQTLSGGFGQTDATGQTKTVEKSSGGLLSGLAALAPLAMQFIPGIGQIGGLLGGAGGGLLGTALGSGPAQSARGVAGSLLDKAFGKG